MVGKSEIFKTQCVTLHGIGALRGTSCQTHNAAQKAERRTTGGKHNKRSLVGGKHQLTDKQIEAQQRYFGKAIRDSVATNVITMNLRIMAGFWHSISTDKEPH